MNHPQSPEFAAQVARIRERNVLGRSVGLARLFDYLADPAREGQTLREADVAAEVFGRTLDLSGDASVRVYVHRLRRKLEAYYAGSGCGEPYRLGVPVGDYRLEILPVHPEGSVAPARSRRWVWAAGLIALVLVAGNATVWWVLARKSAPTHDLTVLAHGPLWSAIGRDRPVIVAVGDYYIFGDTERADEPRRMIRAFEINSPADLDAFLMDNPEFQGRYVDLDTYYTPVGATLALRQILPLVRQTAGRADRVRVITASHLTAEMMKSSDIVYVGYLSALHLLQAPTFERSRYRIGETFDELVDSRTGHSYVSGAGAASGDRPNRDYGYLAAFTGAAGNHIVIIAGARDIGVMQVAEIATDPRALSRLKFTDASATEALYEVDGVGRTNVGATQVVAAR